MTSTIDELQKLQALREAGALSDEEFAAQKGALFAPAPTTPEPPKAPAAAVSQAPQPTVSPTPIADRRSPGVRVADAFRAATGHPAAFTQTAAGERVTTKPLRILDLPFGPVLLTERTIKDGCHACTGAIGVYYLREEGGRTTIAGRYPDAVQGWGWGAPPTDWEVTTRFTALPAIYASGSYMGQGYETSSATITELTPAGPVTSDQIGLGSSNAGAVVEGDGQKVCEVKGRITTLKPDRSFEVAFTGGAPVRARYEKRKGRFVPVRAVEESALCPS